MFGPSTFHSQFHFSEHGSRIWRTLKKKAANEKQQLTFSTSLKLSSPRGVAATSGFYFYLGSEFCIPAQHAELLFMLKTGTHVSCIESAFSFF